MAIRAHTQTTAPEDLEWSTPCIHYTINNGLPSNETYHSLIDQKGYLWISTDKGVSRFNGYEFENFTSEDGLIDNTIFNIYEDHLGKIWFAGYNNKFCYWSWESNSFIPYKYNEVLKANINDNFRIEDFAIDAANSLTIGFVLQGYLIINNEGKIIERNQTFEIQKNKGLYALGLKSVDDYLVKYGYRNNFLYNEDAPQDVALLELWVDNLCKHTFEITFDNASFFIDNIYNNRVKNQYTTFIVDEDFVFFQQPDIQFIHNTKIKDFSPIAKASYFLVKDQYFALINDHLYSLDENLNPIKKLVKITNKELSGIALHGNFLFLNSTTSGIYIVRLNNPIENVLIENFKVAALVQKENKIIAIPEKSTQASIEITQKNISRSNQFPLLDLFNEAFNFYAVIVGAKEPNSTNYINILSRTFREPNYYMLRHPTLLGVSDRSRNSQKLHHLQIKSFCIATYEDKVLLGTQNGIHELVDDSILVPYTFPYLDLNGYRIQDIKVHEDKLIIATRGNGIFICNHDNYVHLTEAKGLSSNIINHTFLAKDMLWVGTNKGVNGIQIQEDTFSIPYKLTKANGIVNNDVLQVLEMNNKLYLGMDNGISIIDYKALSNQSNYTPVLLTSVLVNDTIKLFPKTEMPHLNHDENYLNFQFVGLHFDMNSKVLYRYMLEGLDNEFKYTKERSINYTNLHHGKYNFIVQAKIDDGEWGPIYPAYSFEIHPPYWHTWWFRLLVISLISATTLLLFRHYVSNLKKKNKVLQKLNDLKQQALNAQMNPHFIFNSLNSIQNYILTNNNELANNYLVKYSRLMRIVFENSKKSDIPLAKEIEASKRYLELEAIRNEGKFSFDFIIDPEVNLDQDLIPSLLLQPFLENAIWHGLMKSTKHGLLTVRIIAQEHDIKIEIEDNGIGRQASYELQSKSKLNDHISSGLKITEDRIKLVNVLDKAKFTYQVIDLVDENGKAIGTKIIFTIPKIQETNEKN